MSVPQPLLGEFEQLLLFALLRLGDDVSGTGILHEIEKRAGRSPSPGAIYNSMERLRRRGLVASRLGEPTPERGGKRKKLYTLTGRGAKALKISYEAMLEMSSGLAAKLEEIP